MLQFSKAQKQTTILIIFAIRQFPRRELIRKSISLMQTAIYRSIEYDTNTYLSILVSSSSGTLEVPEQKMLQDSTPSMLPIDLKRNLDNEGWINSMPSRGWKQRTSIEAQFGGPGGRPYYKDDKIRPLVCFGPTVVSRQGYMKSDVTVRYLIWPVWT